MTEMEKRATAILYQAAAQIAMIKNIVDDDAAGVHAIRGKIVGLLEAVTIITGDTYCWNAHGIYKNGSTEPILKV